MWASFYMQSKTVLYVASSTLFVRVFMRRYNTKMLFLVAGSDYEKRKKVGDELITTLQTKRPDASFLEFDDLNFNASRFLETIDGSGLFESKSIVICRSILDIKEMREVVYSALDRLSESNNAYIFTDNKLLAPQIKKFEKAGATVKIFDSKTKGIEKFNTFSLTDLLLAKNKKQLWVAYHEAKEAGVSDEEIHGVLLWQLRSISLSFTHSPAQSNMKPFVFNKAKGAQKKWKQKEVNKHIFNLVANYHEARRGNSLLPLSIESFILTL